MLKGAPVNLLGLLASVPAWYGDPLSRWTQKPPYSGDDVRFLKEERPVDAAELWVEGTQLRIGVPGEGSAVLGEAPWATTVGGPSVLGDLQAALTQRVRAYGRWLYALHGTNRAATSDLSALLAVGYRLVGYSFVLFDGSFDFLAYAGDDLPRSEALAHTIEQGYAMGVSVEHQRDYRRLQTEYPEGFVTYFEEDERRTPVWARTVKTCQGRLCQLHVMGLPSPGACGGTEGPDLGLLGMRALVEEVVDELRIMLERMGSQGSLCLNDDLVQALVTHVVEPGEAQERARFFGWRDSGYRVLRVEPTGEEWTVSRWARCARVLCEKMGDAHASVMDGGVTLLVPTPLREEELADYLEREGLVAGASDERSDLAEAPAAYDEACVAVGCASAPWRLRRGNPLGGVRVQGYESCKMRLLAEALAEAMERRNLVPSCLRAMRAYDAEHASAYAATLLAYVRCWGSKVATCNELSIHRSTLDYRLERLTALFGVNLADEQLWRWLTVVDVGEEASSCGRSGGW